jgi:hypothetical protein
MCYVHGEGERLQGSAKANHRLIAFLQERRPQAVATLDVDATILESQKPSSCVGAAAPRCSPAPTLRATCSSCSTVMV